METKQALVEVANQLWQSMDDDGHGESDAWHGWGDYDVNVYITDEDTVKAVAYPMKKVEFHFDGKLQTVLDSHDYDNPIHLWEKPL